MNYTVQIELNEPWYKRKALLSLKQIIVSIHLKILTGQRVG